uniref:Insulin-like polypeptide B n=1 Tax=Helicoverpa armigera TaxID=29058 RepID=M4QNU1_HELAM|nr:insulin-like precursor polypeptide B [Helicoverpa armigera]
MKVYFVFALIMACVACYAAQESTNFYCGRQLSRALAVVCWGAESKRDAGWWMPQHGGHALAGVRGKRGPVDECCEKSCSVSELMSYC